METNSKLYEAAMDAISELFGDTSVSQSETRENLKTLQGEVRLQPVAHVDGVTLKGIIRKNISKDATIMTDEWTAYNNLSSEYRHERINHNAKEFVRGNVHTNNIENFWSLLKRGIVGIYHHVSEEHLHRYCNEFSFRYNLRKVTDTERFALALNQCEGRLTYKTLTGKE